MAKTPAGGLAKADERLALSVVRRSNPKGPRRRCGSCGLTFSASDLREELDEDGRRVGWTCYGCE